MAAEVEYTASNPLAAIAAGIRFFIISPLVDDQRPAAVCFGVPIARSYQKILLGPTISTDNKIAEVAGVMTLGVVVTVFLVRPVPMAPCAFEMRCFAFGILVNVDTVLTRLHSSNLNSYPDAIFHDFCGDRSNS